MYVLVRINDGDYDIDDLLEDKALEKYGFLYCKNNSFRLTESFNSSFKRKKLRTLLMDVYENSLYYGDQVHRNYKYIDDLISFGYLFVKIKDNRKYVVDPEELYDIIHKENKENRKVNKPVDQEVDLIATFNTVLLKMLGKFKEGNMVFSYYDDDGGVSTIKYEFELKDNKLVIDGNKRQTNQFYYSLFDYFVLNASITITIITDSIINDSPVREIYAMRLSLEGESAFITIVDTNELIKTIEDLGIEGKNLIVCDFDNRIPMEDL